VTDGLLLDHLPPECSRSGDEHGGRGKGKGKEKKGKRTEVLTRGLVCFFVYAGLEVTRKKGEQRKRRRKRGRADRRPESSRPSLSSCPGADGHRKREETGEEGRRSALLSRLFAAGVFFPALSGKKEKNDEKSMPSPVKSCARVRKREG